MLKDAVKKEKKKLHSFCRPWSLRVCAASCSPLAAEDLNNDEGQSSLLNGVQMCGFRRAFGPAVTRGEL